VCPKVRSGQDAPIRGARISATKQKGWAIFTGPWPTNHLKSTVMSKEVEEHEDFNESEVQRQKSSTAGVTPPLGRDLLKAHPVNNDGEDVACRVQDYVEFACADKEKRVRFVTKLKTTQLKKSTGFDNPHSPSTKAIRACILQGSKKPAFEERVLLKQKLKDAKEGKKRNIEKAIRDLDIFIESFRDDVIRGNRNRDTMALKTYQSFFKLGRVLLGFNSRTVAVFNSKHEGDSIYGGVFLQVTDQSPYNSEQREMIAYLMQLLLQTNYADNDDKVKPQFCYAVDVPAKKIVEAPLDSKRLHDRLLRASDELAELWNRIKIPAKK
jgi:hypothetical protein